MNKKIKSVLCMILTLIMIASVMPLGASALSQTKSFGANAKWTYDTKTKTITVSGTGMTTNFENSEETPWDGYNATLVCTIKNKAEKIVINSGITAIGNYAFANLSHVTSVSIPSTVKIIGQYAFTGCSSLTSVNLSNVTTLRKNAFNVCSSLSSILPSQSGVPSSKFEKIDEKAFYGTKISSIVLDRCATSINKNAFNGVSVLSVTCYAGSAADDFCKTYNIRTNYITSMKPAVTLNESAKTIDYSIVIKNGKGFTSGRFTVNYNKDILVPACGTDSEYIDANGSMGVISHKTPGSAVIYVVSSAPASGNDVTVATVSFKAKAQNDTADFTANADDVMINGIDTFIPDAQTAGAGLHAYQKVTTPAACEIDGKTENTCVFCGLVGKTTTIPATGHTESDWILDSEATVDAAGSRHIECTVCHKTLRTEELPQIAVPGNVAAVTAAAQTVNTVKLTWDAVENADYYRIYQYDAAANKNNAIGTTAGLAYTVKNLDAAVTYTFRVRPYRTLDGKNYYSSAYTSVSTTTLPENVTGLNAESNTSSVTLTWNAVSGVTAYAIYKLEDGKSVRIDTATTNSFTVSGLDSNTSYTFRVRPYKSYDGKNFYSPACTDVTAYTAGIPDNVTGLAATAQTINSVTLSWNKVDGADYYRIYQYDPATGKTTAVGYTANLTYKVTGLSAGEVYTFKIKSFSKVNNVNYYCADYTEVDATTLPKPVAALNVKSKNSNTVILNWDKEPTATAYCLYRYDAAQNKNIILGTTTSQTYTIKNLDPGTDYTFRVRSYKKYDGKNYYAPAYTSTSVTTNENTTNVSNVTNFNYTDVTQTSIKFTWDAADGATTYRIYKYDNATKTNVAIASTTALTYTATNLEPGCNYTFRVKAYKVEGGKNYYCPDYSSVLAPTVPNDVTELRATSTTDSVTLSWDAVQGDGICYRIYQYDAATKKNNAIGMTTELTYTLTDIAPATSCTYRIRAYKTLNSKNYYCPAYASAYIATLPENSTGLKATAVTANSVTLTWDAQSGVTGYRVYRYDAAAKKNVLVGTATTSTTFTVTGLNANTAYALRIRPYIAYNNANYYSAAYTSISAKTAA